MPPDTLILIAEHSDLLFEALRSYVLKIVPDAGVTRVRDLGQLLEQAGRAADYNLIVLDGDLPGLAALPSSNELLQRLGQSPLALLASEFRKEDVTRALQCGVNAYLPKSMPGPVIIAGLGLALCGQIYVPPHSRMSPSSGELPAGGEGESSSTRCRRQEHHAAPARDPRAACRRKDERRDCRQARPRGIDRPLASSRSLPAPRRAQPHPGGARNPASVPAHRIDRYGVARGARCR